MINNRAVCGILVLLCLLGTAYHVVFDYKNTPYAELEATSAVNGMLTSPPASETMIPKSQIETVQTMRITEKAESK